MAVMEMAQTVIEYLRQLAGRTDVGGRAGVQLCAADGQRRRAPAAKAASPVQGWTHTS